MTSIQSQHPQDVFSFCPRCGSKNFHKHSSFSKHCKDCDFFYYFNAAGATIALIETQEKELVVVRRSKDPEKEKLDLPGGFVDPGETAEEAMVREIKEELGWTITKLDYIGSLPNTYIFSGFEVKTLDCVFICEVKDIPLKNELTPMDDISEILFLKEKDIDFDCFAFDSTKNAIKMWLKSKQN